MKALWSVRYTVEADLDVIDTSRFVPEKHRGKNVVGVEDTESLGVDRSKPANLTNSKYSWEC